jgi:hypothetical protein
MERIEERRLPPSVGGGFFFDQKPDLPFLRLRRRHQPSTELRSPLTAKYTGKHRDSVLGEGKRRVTPPAPI